MDPSAFGKNPVFPVIITSVHPHLSKVGTAITVKNTDGQALTLARQIPSSIPRSFVLAEIFG
jgi:hypothetical protein